jgi:GDP-L-fucose synthase
MTKILITGCSGLLGTYLIKTFFRGFDCKIIGVDMVPPKLSLNQDEFIFEQMDLTEDGRVEYLFKMYKPDLVINAFGIKGSPIRAKESPVDFLYPSLKINTEIINQCAKRDTWLIFVSSVGVYSPAEKFVESDVWKTLPSEHDWFPSWSKRIGEILLESYKVQYKYDKWSIIRPANIYGDYDDFSGNGTVISSTIKKIYEANDGDTIDCWGDGSPIRDFVYGGDVAEAILKMYNDRIKDVVNFGSGEEITIKTMVENLVEISGKDLKISWDPTKPNGDLRRQMDVTKQKEYNLLPETSFKKGLRKTYYYHLSRFPNPNLKMYTKNLLDNGYYIGDLDEIFSESEMAELNEKINKVKLLSETKKLYKTRYDYPIEPGEEPYEKSITEDKLPERIAYINKHNKKIIQRWWENENTDEFMEVKNYFNDKTEKYLKKVYPESVNNGVSHSNFTLYENGDFIEPHRDGFNLWRYCVILLYLSDEQDYNDGGGKLIIEENGVCENVLPLKGKFCILDFTRNNPKHSVEAVKNNFRRFTYINFYYDGITYEENKN